MTLKLNHAAYVAEFEKSGLGRARLSQLAGLHCRTLDRWRRGPDIPVRLNNLEAVAAALGVQVGAIAISAKGNPDLRRAPQRAENKPQPRLAGGSGTTIAERTAEALAVLAKS